MTPPVTCVDGRSAGAAAAAAGGGRQAGGTAGAAGPAAGAAPAGAGGAVDWSAPPLETRPNPEVRPQRLVPVLVLGFCRRGKLGNYDERHSLKVNERAARNAAVGRVDTHQLRPAAGDAARPRTCAPSAAPGARF